MDVKYTENSTNQTLSESSCANLDKLAQLRTDLPRNPEKIQNSHKRTDLQKRARQKAFSRSIVRNLVKLDSPLHKSYLNSFYCASAFIQTGKSLKAVKYCGNRWCLVCNNIRTGKMINEYLPKLETISDLWFVTLTAGKTVEGDDLVNRISEMMKVFRNITDKFRKQLKRGQRAKQFSGLRKLEVTYTKKKLYHAHFHVLVDGAVNAYELLYEWLERFPDAGSGAQDIQEADHGSLKELFKYFTKMSSKDEETGEIFYHPPFASDIIYRSMYKKRVYQPFGNFIKYLKSDIEGSKIEELEPEKEYSDLIYVLRAVWLWSDLDSDWINKKYGHLTNFELSGDDKKLIQLINDS